MGEGGRKTMLQQPRKCHGSLHGCKNEWTDVREWRTIRSEGEGESRYEGAIIE